MTIVVLSLVFFLLAAGGLSLGLMMGRGGIRGSCRSIGEATDGGSSCACAEPCPRRRRALARAVALDGGRRP